MNRRGLRPAFWTVAVLSFGTSVAAVVQGEGYDTVPLWNAVQALLDGGPVYTEKGAGDFLYPPSALLMLLPLGAVDVIWGNRLFFLANLAAILLATAMLLQLFGLRWRGMPGAIALFALSLTWPVLHTLNAGNANGLVLLGLAAFLVYARRGSWATAGAFLGLTLALKPILLPLLVVVVLYRRWSALAVAAAVPGVLSGLVVVAAPSTRAFFDTTLPLLLKGQSERIQGVSVSLPSVAERLFSPPSPLIGAMQVAVLGITAILLWRRWRSDPAEPRRLVELCSIVLVGAFLVSTFAFSHYGVFLLPLAVSVADPSSRHRNWFTWAALFCVGIRTVWYLEVLPDRVNELLAERVTLGLLGLLLAFWLGTRREQEASSLAPAGAVFQAPTSAVPSQPVVSAVASQEAVPVAGPAPRSDARR